MDKIKLFSTQKNIISKSIIDNNFDFIGSTYDTLKHNTRLNYSDKITNLAIDKYGLAIKTNPTTFLKGNNIEQLELKELSTFKEQFEDSLKINTDNCQLTGFDYNINLSTQYPPVSYLQAFRSLPKYTQSIYPYGKGLSYINQCKTFNVYDKIKQLEKQNIIIPSHYLNSNLLRMELQVKQKMKQTKELTNINTLKDLLNNQNYLSVINQFQKTFNNIHKQPLTRYADMVQPNPNEINSTDFALIYYINEIGMDSYINLLEQEKNMKLISYRQYKVRKDKAMNLWYKYSLINKDSSHDLLNELQTKYNDKIEATKQIILSHV